MPGLNGNARDYSARYGVPGQAPESIWNFKQVIDASNAAQAARPRGAGSRWLGGRTVDEIPAGEQDEAIEHLRRLHTDPEYRARQEEFQANPLRFVAPGRSPYSGQLDPDNPDYEALLRLHNVYVANDPAARGAGHGKSPVPATDPPYVYRTIGPHDPHTALFPRVGDVGTINPRGGHNDLTLHVQLEKTNSIFTSWSKDAAENWKMWGNKPGYIQVRVDARILSNPMLDVSGWSLYPLEKEVTIIGPVPEAVRVK